MDLQKINEIYGKYIWKVSNRYHVGIWSPEDVFSQILILIYTAQQEGRLKDNVDEDAKIETISFIITRAIDIVRHEIKRKKPDVTKIDFREIASPSPEQIYYETMSVKDLLESTLNPETARFIFELAFPSYRTVEIAIRDKEEAKADSNLRMNIRGDDVVILPKHVFESLYNRQCSGSSISKLKNEARSKLARFFGLDAGNIESGQSIDNIVAEILNYEEESDNKV